MVRIRDGSTKAAVIVGCYTLAVGTGFLLAVAGMPGRGVAVTVMVVLALSVVLARLCRGEGESDDPRVWWRMTAHPAAGYALAAWFLLQAAGSVPLAVGMPAGWISVTASVVLAVGYLHSSLRLSA